MWSWVYPRITCCQCPFSMRGNRSVILPDRVASLWGAVVLGDMIDSVLSFLQWALLTDELTHWNGANWQSGLRGLRCTRTRVITYVWGYREGGPESIKGVISWVPPSWEHDAVQRDCVSTLLTWHFIIIFLRSVILCSILSEFHLTYQIWSEYDQICEI